jgi:hypothetical protein
MKQLTALALVLLLGSGPLFSQSVVTSVNYNKTPEPALMLELPYKEEIAEDFIIDNLKKTGFNPETKGSLFWKQNKLNGFYIFKGVRLEGIPQTVDLYFRVEQKSRRAKDQSIIYLLVSKGEENFVSSTSDAPAYQVAKNFLNGFVSQSAVYKLELDVKAQEDVVRNEEKKLDKLKDNEKDLNRKSEQLQKDLKRNREDQENQEKLLENQRKKLSDLRTRTI